MGGNEVRILHASYGIDDNILCRHYIHYSACPAHCLITIKSCNSPLLDRRTYFASSLSFVSSLIFNSLPFCIYLLLVRRILVTIDVFLFHSSFSSFFRFFLCCNSVDSNFVFVTELNHVSEPHAQFGKSNVCIETALRSDSRRMDEDCAGHEALTSFPSLHFN